MIFLRYYPIRSTMSATVAEITKLISDAEITDVADGILARKAFRTTSYILEALGEVCHAASIILLSIASPLGYEALIYWALALNVASMSFRLLKSYSMSESRNRTLEINIITKKLKIPELPDTVLDEELLSSRPLQPSSGDPAAVHVPVRARGDSRPGAISPQNMV